MFSGRVEAIFVGADADAAMISVEHVRAIDGVGLEGDRYGDGAGTFSAAPGGGRHVTLLEAEAVEAVRAEGGIDLAYDELRRNVLTRGVPLNHLVNEEFDVGDVRLRGVRLCEPCRHIAERTGKPVIQPMLHRAGLRADIVRGGVIRVGDPISG